MSIHASLLSSAIAAATALPRRRLLLSPSLAISAIAIHIPASISGLWDFLLRAAPKKKTSYGKKRSRQLAGKALKDTIAISQCPACGSPKRSHLLCPNCVAEIQKQWRQQKNDTQAEIEPSP